MPEAVLESRVSIAFDWGNILMSLDEAQELFEQLQEVLPKDRTEYNTRGSFGFRVQEQEDTNE